ncbi:hypothetical protein WOLCODRAFT_79384, partial [Wolfiporia cocos MD-104 SS10]
MSSHREWFVNYSPLASPQHVWLGDERYILAIGIGQITLHFDTPDSTKSALIQNVFHVPELNGNLLSVSNLTKRDYEVNFTHDECMITSPNGTLTVTAREEGNLF